MVKSQHIQFIFLKSAEGKEKKKTKDVTLTEEEDKIYKAQVSVVILFSLKSVPMHCPVGDG